MGSVVIFGATGLLGSSLCQHLANCGFEVIQAGRASSSNRILDVTDSSAIADLFRATVPSHVINLVAATDVDRCESDVSYAYLANTKVPGAIAAAMDVCGHCDIHAVHISTDQVYAGPGPHSESNINPINVYGLSKYAGELLFDTEKTAILRTNFYGRSKLLNRESFSDWLVNVLKRRESIKLFDDVLFSALNIQTLCELVIDVMNQRVTGTFNVGCANSISKAKFAIYLASKLGLPTDKTEVCRLVDLSLKARRPTDMTLDVRKFESAMNLRCPDIFDQISLTAEEYLNE